MGSMIAFFVTFLVLDLIDWGRFGVMYAFHDELQVIKSRNQDSSSQSCCFHYRTGTEHRENVEPIRLPSVHHSQSL